MTVDIAKLLRGVPLACVLLVGCSSMTGANTSKAENEKVRIVSSHVGLMFAPNETLDVGLRLEGALRAATLDYTVEQLGGDWRSQGKIKTPAVPSGGSTVAPVPLTLPEPGLYRLRLQGSLGGKLAQERMIAVLAEAPPVDVNSPWGIFYTPPVWFEKNVSQAAKEAARSIRALGASWVRFGFWESYGPVTVTPAGPDGKREVHMNITDWKDYARELHAEKLYLMGNMAMVPRALSSQPKNEQTLGDGGPAYSHVPPFDYGLWEQFVEQVAQTFKEEITAWEIWNEPDNQGVYWQGSLDEFGALIHHTSLALRRVNPQMKIASAGFTNERRAHDWMNRLIELGVAKDIDVFSVHYTDRQAIAIDRWHKIMQGKNVNLPLWNTEEDEPVPIFNLEHGIARSFKFLHVAVGYEASRPLVEKDYTLRPAGMEYAMGARCLGTARFLKSQAISGGWLHFFQRGGEVVGVIQREPLSVFLDSPHPLTVSLKGSALDSAHPITVTTGLGRITTVKPSESGELQLTVRDPLVFINGCSTLEATGSAAAVQSFVIAEAETAKPTGPWEVIERRDSSGQRAMELWNAEISPTKQAALDFKLAVPADGKYEVLLAGGSLDGLKPPRTTSPFSWSVDGQPAVRVDAPPPALAGAEAVLNGLSRLGAVPLKKGEHVFHLQVVGPIDAYPLAKITVDAVVLRLVAK